MSASCVIIRQSDTCTTTTCDLHIRKILLYWFFQSISLVENRFMITAGIVSYLCGEIWWKCFGSSESFHKKCFPVRILMVDGYENKLYMYKKIIYKKNIKIYNYFHSAKATSHYLNSKETSKFHQIGLMFHIHFGGTSGFPLEAHHPTGWISGIHRLRQKSLLESLSKPSQRRRALKPEK